MMYKFSILFQYKHQDGKFVFFIGKSQYILEVTIEEKDKVVLFINRYLGESFSQDNFYEICNFERQKSLFNFFQKTNIILEKQKGNISEIINWADISYNPSILHNNLGESEAFLLCKNQHLLGNNKIIKKQSGGLFHMLKQRKSHRKFKESKYKKNEISYLFQCMYGNIRKNNYMGFNFTHKTTPSGGAFFPLEIFLFRFYKNTIGLYSFDGNTLNYVKKIPSKKQFINTNILQNSNLDFENSLGLVIILSNLEYIGKKYGAKSYQLSLLEGGHASQNFILAGIEKSYGTCELGGVYEHQLIKECGKHGKNYIFINSILFGKI